MFKKLTKKAVIDAKDAVKEESFDILVLTSVLLIGFGLGRLSKSSTTTVIKL